MFIYIIIYILLWGVIHFQQIYLECMFMWHVCGICSYSTMAHWYKYDFTIQLFMDTYHFSTSLKTI